MALWKSRNVEKSKKRKQPNSSIHIVVVQLAGKVDLLWVSSRCDTWKKTIDIKSELDVSVSTQPTVTADTLGVSLILYALVNSIETGSPSVCPSVGRSVRC